MGFRLPWLLRQPEKYFKAKIFGKTSNQMERRRLADILLTNKTMLN